MEPPMYHSAKTYGHDLGLSCCFRQHQSNSHCQYLHGYALAVKLDFVAEELDEAGWVLDFGGLKEVKKRIVDLLDHKTLVARDDPQIDVFKFMAQKGIIQLEVLNGISCERLAKHIYDIAEEWLHGTIWHPRVRLASVAVREHESNEAIYEAIPS